MSLGIAVLIYIVSSYFVYAILGRILIALEPSHRPYVKMFFILSPFFVLVILFPLFIEITVRVNKPSFFDHLFGKD